MKMSLQKNSRFFNPKLLDQSVLETTDLFLQTKGSSHHISTLFDLLLFTVFYSILIFFQFILSRKVLVVLFLKASLLYSVSFFMSNDFCIV